MGNVASRHGKCFAVFGGEGAYDSDDDGNDSEVPQSVPREDKRNRGGSMQRVLTQTHEGHEEPPEKRGGVPGNIPSVLSKSNLQLESPQPGTQPGTHSKERLDIVTQMRKFHTRRGMREAFDGYLTKKYTGLATNVATNIELSVRKFSGDKFSPGHILGKGTTAIVRVVEETCRNNKKYACKIIDISKFNEKNIMALKAELDVLILLDHPQIIKFNEVVEDETTQNLYVITELCTGGELFQYLSLQQRVPEDQAKLWIYQMLGTVNHCHHKGVMHGDLKPENFVFADESHQMIKLIDFGISKRLRRAENIQEAREFVGTLQYMPPETIKDGTRTKASDMWSMGVICFQLLSGRLPFGGGNAEDTQESIRLKIGRGLRLIGAKDDVSRALYPRENWDRADPPVSRAAQELIKNLVRRKPDQRWSAEEALQKPYMLELQPAALRMSASYSEASPLSAGGEVYIARCGGKTFVQKASAYKEMSSLRQLGLIFIALHVDTPEIVALRDLFRRIDRKQDGVIDKEELRLSLQATISNTYEDSPSGNYKVADMQHTYSVPEDEEVDFEAMRRNSTPNLSDEEIFKIFEEMDKDGAGEISYSEFIAATMQCNDLQEDDIREAFKLLDRDGDGVVTCKDLRILLQGHGHDSLFTEEKLNEMIETVDADHDGTISYEEFRECMHGHTCEPIQRNDPGDLEIPADMIRVDSSNLGLNELDDSSSDLSAQLARLSGGLTE